MEIPEVDCRNLQHALALEWLETNGLGGFASGTVAGANTRRYHALLLLARTPPSDRVALVNHIEEWIEYEGRQAPLSTNLYHGAVHPNGYEACTGFSTEPWPTWTYACEGRSYRRELFMPRGRDVVVLRWRRLDAMDGAVTLRVRPMLTGRDYHATHHENAVLAAGATVGDGSIVWQPYADLPPVRALHNGAYRHEPDWYRHLHFPQERQRGLDSDEDWWSPGAVTFTLAGHNEAILVFTTEMTATIDADDLARQEEARRRRRRARAHTDDRLATDLAYAAEAYLCQRGNGQTVLAGYPWFTDWGRDTFIALPGLCLVTGRYETARHIIDSFAAVVSEGMVPNRFPDTGGPPAYNTVDASLWFIHALERYLLYAGDMAHVERVGWPAVKAILSGYRHGTRFGIRMDRDGLIACGEPGVQLTWMDAKIGDWVVTPRHGKPVEIQALWIRALAVGEMLAEKFGDTAFAAACRRDRAQAIQSFQNRFWYQTGGYLYDVIDGPDGDDPSLRPNQLYALALCDHVLTQEQTRSAMRVVEEQLLTPVGLRTLSPQDPHYRPRCDGGVSERDSAYHQGTVWPFLLGVFVTAWLKVNGTGAVEKTKARTFLDGLADHLHQACLGQVSEIFDGQAPHVPRGCIAQAWSVAEPLRALVEDLGIQCKKP